MSTSRKQVFRRFPGHLRTALVVFVCLSWLVNVAAAQHDQHDKNPSAGPKPPRQHLVVTRMDLPQILGKLVRPGTLVVTDPFNAEVARSIGRGKVVVIEDNRRAHLMRRIQAAGAYEDVVGIGGGTAIDASTIAAMGKKRLVKVPLLSTACISTKKAIVREWPGLLGAFKRLLRGEPAYSKNVVIGRPQDLTVISLPYHLSAPDDPTMARRKAAVMKKWVGSAAGDLLGGLSAALDRAPDPASNTLTRQVKSMSPEAAALLRFVTSNTFHGLDEELIRQVATNVHRANVNESIVGGGEHQFYYYLFNKWGRYRKSHRSRGVPTHGQLVAMGTLVAAKVMAKETGDSTLFDQLKEACDRLGLVTSRRAMAGIGLKDRHVVEALAHVSSSTAIGRHVRGERQRAQALVDEVFGPGPGRQ